MTDPNGQLEITCTVLHNTMSNPQKYGAKHIADATSQYNSAGCTSADILTAAEWAKLGNNACTGSGCGTMTGSYGPSNGSKTNSKGSGSDSGSGKGSGKGSGSGSGSSSTSTYMIIGVVGLVAVGGFLYLRK